MANDTMNLFQRVSRLSPLLSLVLSLTVLTDRARADIIIDLGRGPVTVHVPSSYDPAAPAPLIMLLHGYGFSGDALLGWLDIDSLSEEMGFVYAAPDGSVDGGGARFWNATDACCDFFGSGIDDSSYLRALTDEVRRQLSINEKRVYFFGHSNGGFMAYRMACDHPDLVAGIASLAGATFDNVDDCAPDSPVHILQIHGTNDGVIRYGGGNLNGVPYPGAVRSIRTWLDYNGCRQRKDESCPNLDLDSSLAGDETTVTKFTKGCPHDGSGELWTIVGGVHSPALSADFNRHFVNHLMDHPKPGDWLDLGFSIDGTRGTPTLVGDSSLVGGTPLNLFVGGALENTPAFLVVGLDTTYAPFGGGTLVPCPDVIVAGLSTDASGQYMVSSDLPVGLPTGFSIYFQSWQLDPLGPAGFSATNGLGGIIP